MVLTRAMRGSLQQRVEGRVQQPRRASRSPVRQRRDIVPAAAFAADAAAAAATAADASAAAAATSEAADALLPRCLICLEAVGAPRHSCGHTFCGPCWQQYLRVRIDERSVLELPCPASGTAPGERHCQEVSRVEVAASLDGAWLHRYDAFVAAQRAERDPETRWCAQPSCGTVCLPCVEESPVSAGTAVACFVGSAALASLPLLYPTLSEAIGLTPRLGIATAVLGALGFGGAFWHGSGRVGPRRRAECPSCRHSVCQDCKAPWHPGTLCEELHAAQLVRWCARRDAGQCPRCGVFIERRAGCNHMDCRCGHSFCWLCLGPLSERCSCPQFGGRRTAEARARLACVSWRRAILFAADTAALRGLFGALLTGAVLQQADLLCAGVCAALTALLEAPRATKLAFAQLVLSLAHLALARASLRAVPRRLASYLAVRQIDISLIGLGTFRLIALMKRLESWGVLPPHPPPMPRVTLLQGDRRRPRLELVRDWLVQRLRSFVSATFARDDAPRLTAYGAREPVRVIPACRDPPEPAAPHLARPFGLNNSQGYTMSRRCRAALPAVANAAYELESLLPVVYAPLAAGLVSLVTRLVVIAFWAVSCLLVPFAAACVAPAGAALPTRLLAMLPTALAYAWGALGTVGALGFSCIFTFRLCFFAVASLLGGVLQAGVQRRMHTRVTIDPEVELDELRLDGELNYKWEELQYDALRLLMDGRALLLHASLFVAFDRFSVDLWADLEAMFEPTGVFCTGLVWSPLSSVLPVGINPFYALLHGLHLPAAMVRLASCASPPEWHAECTSTCMLTSPPEWPSLHAGVPHRLQHARRTVTIPMDPRLDGPAAPADRGASEPRVRAGSSVFVPQPESSTPSRRVALLPAGRHPRLDRRPN